MAVDAPGYALPYASPPYRPFSRSNTSYTLMNDWMKLSGRTMSSGAPVSYDRGTWRPRTTGDGSAPDSALSQPSPHTARPSTSSKADQQQNYFQKFHDLSQNIAYRYPDPGPPREKIGRVGGNWRHIKQVLGYGGNQVCFVDGLVRLYEKDMYQPGLAGRGNVRTPLYAANRHNVSSYGKIIQTEREKRDFRPWEDTQHSLPNISDKPSSPMKNNRLGSPTKHKGFYQMRRENTVG